MAVGSLVTVSETSPGVPVEPDIACSDDGRFVAVWRATNVPFAGDRIYASVFNASGMLVTGDIPVDDPMTPGPKGAPAVAWADSGEFLVVWQANDAGMDEGIFGRVFDSLGTWMTPQTAINSTTPGPQRDPAVAFIRTPEEAFAVVWEGGVGEDIYLRRVRRVDKGLISGSEIVVNTAITGVQENPDVGVSGKAPDEANENRIAVVWQTDASNGRVMYRLFDTLGVALSQVESEIDDDPIDFPLTAPSVSMADALPELQAQLIATWTQGQFGRHAAGIPVAIVGASRPRSPFSELAGAPPANPEFWVSIGGPAIDGQSDVALQADGDLMAVWERAHPDLGGIYGRFFEANWPAVIFGDGFESGNTSAWSSTLPFDE